MDQVIVSKNKLFYGILGAIVVSLCAWSCVRTAKSFASLDPKNEYVGVEACQPCHSKITQSYLQTGMGKSMYPPSQDNLIERFGEKETVYDAQLDMHYQALWRGDRFYIREYRIDDKDTLHQRSEEVDYVVGSGHQTRSYLIQKEGYLYEAPITWYVNKAIWDLSPGYDVSNARFDREIGLTCMACHTGYVDRAEGSKNRYRYISEGIDCEKCHGPGAIHIQKIEAGQMIDVGMETDYSIVNPAKLPIQKQFDVCQQCHLQGINVLDDGKEMADFRPAMALDELGDVFVEVDPDQNAFGIASHAQRLQQSQCFIQSKGKLTCTTCHDPHKSISQTEVDVFSRQCQSCHQSGMEKLCSEERDKLSAENNNCISCHMPSGGTSDIPHVSFHDHNIRVVQKEDSLETGKVSDILRLVCATDSQVSGKKEALAWLNYYETQQRGKAFEEEVNKRKGALSPYDLARFYFYQGEYQKAEEAIAEISVPYTPLQRFLKGEIAEALGQHEAAFEIFMGLYQENQERWDAGLKAGVNLLRAREGDPRVLDEAKAIFKKLEDQKPFDARVKTNLAFIALNQRDFRTAESLLARSLAQNPDDLKALENMVFLQSLKRNSLQARLYLDRLRARHPDYPRLAALEELI